MELVTKEPDCLIQRDVPSYQSEAYRYLVDSVQILGKKLLDVVVKIWQIAFPTVFILVVVHIVYKST